MDSNCVFPNSTLLCPVAWLQAHLWQRGTPAAAPAQGPQQPAAAVGQVSLERLQHPLLHARLRKTGNKCTVSHLASVPPRQLYVI